MRHARSKRWGLWAQGNAAEGSPRGTGHRTHWRSIDGSGSRVRVRVTPPNTASVTGLPARPKTRARGRSPLSRPRCCAPGRCPRDAGWVAGARDNEGVRPGTTIALAMLLVLIFAAAFAQFVLRLSP